MIERTVRRLANRLDKASIAQLARLIEADMSGRPPLPRQLPGEARELLGLAASLELTQHKPPPILMGRHLIALGHPPDIWFGAVLRTCFEAQLDGEFTNEESGLEFLRRLLTTSGPMS